MTFRIDVVYSIEINQTKTIIYKNGTLQEMLTCSETLEAWEAMPEDTIFKYQTEKWKGLKKVECPTLNIK